MRKRFKRRFTYLMLLATKALSRLFYRFEVDWIGRLPKDPWKNVRLVLLLNHTSLFEPLFAGWVPNRFLKSVARNGLVPVADKTMLRPVVGRFFKLVADNVIPISRKRDHSWVRFVEKIRTGSMVVIAPEGRMKRKTGLDLTGSPMTVRGGVADLLKQIQAGRMLIAYSGGLHHVQSPGQRLPRLFKTLRMRVETMDISTYSRMIASKAKGGFKQAVVEDLQIRRDIYCPGLQAQPALIHTARRTNGHIPR
jgi:1-acyl-sn-glycerol-3-phosphate acyltransferase